MDCNIYINFGGDCRDALVFYAKVFRLPAPEIQLYRDTPYPSGDTPNEADKDRVLHAMLPIAGSNMMFSDCPSDFPLVKGNNFAISLWSTDENEVKRIFAELSEGGTVEMPLEKTFFSELFGIVTDRFGISWQVCM